MQNAKVLSYNIDKYALKIKYTKKENYSGKTLNIGSSVLTEILKKRAQYLIYNLIHYYEVGFIQIIQIVAHIKKYFNISQHINTSVDAILLSQLIRKEPLSLFNTDF